MTCRKRASIPRPITAAGSVALVALVALAACIAFEGRASARPYKTDYNANICEEMSGTIARRSDGIKATSAGGSLVLCPLDVVTMPTDSTGGTVNISFKAYYTGPTNLYCDLNGYWSILGWSYWSGPTSNSGGIISSTPAAWSFPGAASESPYSLYVYCSLPKDTILGIIQLTTN